MSAHFPNLDVLRLALTSDILPDAVRTSAARFAFDVDQSLWVEPAVPLSDSTIKNLQRLGVRFPPQSAIELVHDATNWLQMIPLTRERRAVEADDKTPILFELARHAQLAALATEILRLGNDRQSFRWLEDGAASTALLRVVGPPYYSLLRAIDSNAEDEAPIAYREVAPRVWLQMGYTHSLAEHLKPPAGQWLLMRPPHRWTYVPEGQLRDIYEVIDFQIAEGASSWNDVELPAHINVPVKLTHSGAPEAAELWLLREAGIAQLEELVRSADNELLARLAFAVGEKDGERIVVLRVRPSKNAPPVLVLEGLGFRSYLRIPGLFLPVGMVLHPPLRRDAVIKLLAADKLRITWLVPHADNTFTPESLPDAAFRPLPDWIDYVLEHDHQAIKAWLGAAQFQFEAFVCKDDQPKEKKPPEPKPPKKPKPKERDDGAKPNAEVEALAPKKAQPADLTAEAETRADPGELERRLRGLEEAFAARTTPLDDPERQSIWREMAQLNGALAHHADGAVCWSNALWETPRVPAEWPLAWVRQEAQQPVGAALLDRILDNEAPTHGNLRLLSAYLIWAAAAPTPPAELPPQLAKVQRYLEKHEGYLGVRTIWLAWHALHQLAGGDVLALARARDRLLERLFVHGLTPELDQPGFLRYSGLQASTRFRMVRDQVVRLHTLVQDWAKTGANPTPTTHAYIDLIFAFGLARLGETAEARNLLGAAAQVLAVADEVHSWLYEAFEFRVQQALDGKPGVERLPEKLLRQLDAIEHPDYLQHLPAGKQRDDVKDAQRFLRLKIDRLREKSRILEPLEKIDAYRIWHGRFADELTRELAGLTDLHDRVELIQRLQQLLRGKQKIKGAKSAEPRILIAALELAPRLGQAFGEEVLERAPAQFAKWKDAELNAELLEKSLFLAAHLDRKEDVQRFAVQLGELLQSPNAIPYEKLIPLVAGSFRSLRKFGLRDLVAQLMQRLGEIIEADPALRAGGTAARASGNRGKRLGLLLELASAWFFFGEEDKARRILDEAKNAMFRKELMTIDLVHVACAYLTALGQAPMEFALSRIMEFFRKAEGIYDMWTTSSHYSLTRLNVVEAMMLALCSDDFTLDRDARQRLDEDEFLVRRRIHRDVREAMER